MIRILVVDDQPLVRRALRARLDLEADMTVVAEAEDGAAALVAAGMAAPDVVLMDIQMPVLDGIEATRAIRAAGTAAVVLLTMHDDSVTRSQGQGAGAAAVVGKREGPNRLVEVIRAVATGG